MIKYQVKKQIQTAGGRNSGSTNVGKWADILDQGLLSDWTMF